MTSLGTGHVTDCPAYLSVTLNDRTASEELSRYDALISCPPRFNITINVPPPPPTSVTGDGRVFEVVLHDSKIEQRVFLSTLVVRDAAGDDRLRSDARPVDRSLKCGGIRPRFFCRGFGDLSLPMFQHNCQIITNFISI